MPDYPYPEDPGQTHWSESVVGRFWKRVDRSSGDGSCWPWTGYRQPKGYGRLWVNGGMMLAHRLAYELENGAIGPGRVVMHSCDNPPCCNPQHLSVGSVADNNIDRDMKGRRRMVRVIGEQHGRSRLTEALVCEIRELRMTGLLQRDIAKKVGVTQQTISRVLSRASKGGWAHVR